MMIRHSFFLLFFTFLSCSQPPNEAIEFENSISEYELLGSGNLYPLAVNPQFTTVSATNLDDDILVGMINFGSEIRVYPYPYTYNHEIINDSFEQTKFAFTYCPLTKSAVAFYRENNFRASGFLLNDNLVALEEASSSLWSQMLGIGIRGPEKDKKIQTIPVLETKWKTVKTYFQNAKVLTDDYISTTKGDGDGNGSSTSTYAPKEGDLALGIVSRLSKVYIFKYEDFIDQKRINIAVSSASFVIIGDNSKRIINGFKIPNFNDFSTLENEFPFVLESKEGVKYDIFGIGTDGSELEKATFSYVALWGAWKRFYADFVFVE